MAKALAKLSACFQLRWAGVSINASLEQVFLSCHVEKSLKKAEGSTTGICYAKEGSDKRSIAKTYLLLQRQKCERKGRFAHPSCWPLAYSGSKAKQMILLLNH